MKKLFFLLSGALLLANLFVSTGCEDDPVEKNPPLVTVADTPIDDVLPGAAFTFSVTADQGTDPLNSLTITEGEVSVDPSRIAIDGIDPANNPQLIPDADKATLTWNITITAPDVEAFYSYEVTVADEGGLSDFAGFDINVATPVPVGTPIDSTLTGVLFNQAGPTGKGTLDLDAGLSAGVTSTGETTPDQAEIRDMGLDCTIPAPGFNWRRQIGGFNGTEIRTVDLAALENFTFDNVVFKEEIEEAFSTGFTLSAGQAESCTGGADVPVDYVSDVLAVGDLLVVSSGSKTYLIRVDAVDETGSDNDDSYTFSIKY